MSFVHQLKNASVYISVYIHLPPSAGCGLPVEQVIVEQSRKSLFPSQNVRVRNQDGGLHNSWCRYRRAASGGRQEGYKQEELHHLRAVCSALPGWAVRDDPVCICGLCVCYWECWRCCHSACFGTWTGTGSAHHGVWANKVKTDDITFCFCASNSLHCMFLSWLIISWFCNIRKVSMIFWLHALFSHKITQREKDNMHLMYF